MALHDRLLIDAGSLRSRISIRLTLFPPNLRGRLPGRRNWNKLRNPQPYIVLGTRSVKRLPRSSVPHKPIDSLVDVAAVPPSRHRSLFASLAVTNRCIEAPPKLLMACIRYHESGNRERMMPQGVLLCLLGLRFETTTHKSAPI